MPQMSPMKWTILYFMFTLIIIMFNSMIFFSPIFLPPMFKLNIYNTSLNKWKW